APTACRRSADRPTPGLRGWRRLRASGTGRPPRHRAGCPPRPRCGSEGVACAVGPRFKGAEAVGAGTPLATLQRVKPAVRSIHGGCIMLLLTRKVGERIVIDGRIVIEVLRVKGDRIRLGIQAPPDVHIVLEELLTVGTASAHYPGAGALATASR